MIYTNLLVLPCTTPEFCRVFLLYKGENLCRTRHLLTFWFWSTLQAVPLQFLHALLAYLGDSTGYAYPSSGQKSPLASRPSSCCFGTEAPSEGLVRWQLRLEYFAYETLQDLRIASYLRSLWITQTGDCSASNARILKDRWREWEIVGSFV